MGNGCIGRNRWLTLDLTRPVQVWKLNMIA